MQGLVEAFNESMSEGLRNEPKWNSRIERHWPPSYLAGVVTPQELWDKSPWLWLKAFPDHFDTRSAKGFSLYLGSSDKGLEDTTDGLTSFEVPNPILLWTDFENPGDQDLMTAAYRIASRSDWLLAEDRPLMSSRFLPTRGMRTNWCCKDSQDGQQQAVAYKHGLGVLHTRYEVSVLALNFNCGAWQKDPQKYLEGIHDYLAKSNAENAEQFLQKLYWPVSLKKA